MRAALASLNRVSLLDVWFNEQAGSWISRHSVREDHPKTHHTHSFLRNVLKDGTQRTHGLTTCSCKETTESDDSPH